MGSVNKVIFVGNIGRPVFRTSTVQLQDIELELSGWGDDLEKFEHLLRQPIFGRALSGQALSDEAAAQTLEYMRVLRDLMQRIHVRAIARTPSYALRVAHLRRRIHRVVPLTQLGMFRRTLQRNAPQQRACEAQHRLLRHSRFLPSAAATISLV